MDTCGKSPGIRSSRLWTSVCRRMSGAPIRFLFATPFVSKRMPLVHYFTAHAENNVFFHGTDLALSLM
ncbi:MAG: hypothetical protein JWN23_512 [Rhodocyclales bacterium]|nr:hypothetical protein [Rhodocyclales bacterium]